MNSFPEWFKDLCSDVRWYENAVMSCRGKNFKGAAEFVYAQVLADPALQLRSMVENRKHVYNRLTRMDFERVFPQLQQPKEEKQEEFKPASDEHVAKCVAEFDEMLKNSPMLNGVPKVSHKQAVEEGDWIPKKKEYTPPSIVEKIIILKESKQRIRECRRKFFLDAFPDATEEEIRAYWEKFEDTKDESI